MVTANHDGVKWLSPREPRSVVDDSELPDEANHLPDAFGQRLALGHRF